MLFMLIMCFLLLRRSSVSEKETVLSVVERLESTLNTTIEAVLNEVEELGTAVMSLIASKKLTKVNVFSIQALLVLKVHVYNCV